MSDGLTAVAQPEPHAAPPQRVRRPVAQVAAVQAVVIVVVFAVVGAGAGWLWFQLWDPPSGVVAGGSWYTDETGLREAFSGVALYVAIAAVTGLVLGCASAWLLDRSELVTLAAVLAGSALAGYLMLRVGHELSPPDPQRLAATAADGTKLPGQLSVDSWPPRAAFPFGALVGLVVVYLSSVKLTPSEPQPRDPASGEGTRQ